jgi:ABC-2 type transport system ATP-binding protein
MSDRVTVRELTVRYGSSVAVDQVTFELLSGQCTTLLGLNGAGKSTIMDALTGLKAPARGEVRIFGLDPVSRASDARRRFGYLPEEDILDGALTLLEHLELCASLHGMPKSVRRERVDFLVDRLDLSSVLNRPMGSASRGFRQRASLAVVLFHDPDLVILDEPVTGLDPEQQTSFHELVRELAKSRVILLSTHLLSEARNLADRVLVLSMGRLMYDGPMTSDDSLRRALIGEEI